MLNFLKNIFKPVEPKFDCEYIEKGSETVKGTVLNKVKVVDYNDKTVWYQVTMLYGNTNEPIATYQAARWFFKEKYREVQ